MKNYTFVDYATQGYLLVVALLILAFHNERTPLGHYLVAAHALGLTLIHLLIRYHASGRRGRVVAFLRYFYPILLFTGFYRETGALHHMFFADFLDPTLIRLEEQIFGMQPSLEFMERLPPPGSTPSTARSPSVGRSATSARAGRRRRPR